jgi:LysR family transcriptional regulator, benzoate and cis,cis-muconate-responsive activator of ben and cat genes
MELKHLRSFVAVARALSFSRAARDLHLSQPALSTQIRLLEEQLGATLLLRNRRKVALTVAGESLLHDAEALLAQVEEVRLKVQRLSAGDLGHLRIGFVASATSTLVPAVATIFRKRYPGVTISLKNLPTAQQVEGIRNGTLDAGFVRMPLKETGLHITLISREPFAIVLPREHPLARKADLRVGDLMNEPFVAYGERWAPSFYQRWTALCRNAGFTPKITQETGEMETAIALVAAGLGVAILPEGITRRHRGVIFIRSLKNEQIRSEIGIAIPSARQTPLLKRLVVIAKQVGNI